MRDVRFLAGAKKTSRREAATSGFDRQKQPFFVYNCNVHF
jgi:hypothetical protein